MIDPIETDESSEATPRKLPTEATDRADPIDPIDRTEPTDPMERIDPFEPIDRIELVELTDHRELRPTPTDATGEAGPGTVWSVTGWSPRDRSDRPRTSVLRHW